MTGRELLDLWAARDEQYAVLRWDLTDSAIVAVREFRTSEVLALIEGPERAWMVNRAHGWTPPPRWADGRRRKV
jgi:hypothetical protein